MTEEEKKAIKVIDLLNMISKGEEAPKKVKLGNIIWNYDEKEKTYFMNNTEIELFYIEKITKKLNDEVEIIEEEPEIDIQGIEELDNISEFNTTATIGNHFNKINELVRAIKQLDNQINNK